MITAYVSEEPFRDDAIALIRAFYPEETVITKLSGPGEGDVLSVKVIRDGDDREPLEVRLDRGVRYTKTERRNEFKKRLYTGLSAKTGRSLPWGALTGVRPTRLAMRELERGRDRKEAEDALQRSFFVSPEKAALAVRIAVRELKILSRLPFGEGYSVYIGIPFCPSRCLYCSFSSYPIGAMRDMEEAYLKALYREIDFAATVFPERIPDTVYIGGGTPTALSEESLEDLLGYVNQKLNADRIAEFTVEAGRPDSINREKLRIMKAHGVSRICVNPQTMNDETLKTIGRAHSAAQVREAFDLARQEGFDNINMDIILGLPGEGEEEIRHTMEEIVKMKPDDLTVHSLAVKRASRLAEERERVFEIGLHNTDEMMSIAASGACGIGLTPYYLYRQKNIAGNFENTGYAREAGKEEGGRGTEGLYNILMMEEVQPIIACGAGTVSKMIRPDPGSTDGKHITRCDTLKEVGPYIERVGEMIERKRRLFL